MKDYNVVAYLNIECEFQVQARDEDEAMRIINERLERKGATEVIRDSGFVVVTEAGAVDCWEVEE